MGEGVGSGVGEGVGSGVGEGVGSGGSKAESVAPEFTTIVARSDLSIISVSFAYSESSSPLDGVKKFKGGVKALAVGQRTV